MTAAAAVPDQTLEELPVDCIQTSRTNPRRSFDAASQAELAASIGQIGIQTPLLVRPAFDSTGQLEEGTYELVTGERRWRAAKSLELETVPCLVREMTDEEAREIQIVENLQRADVHPVDEAEAYAKLSGTAEDIAKRVGKSVAYVAQRMKLLDLIPLASRLFLSQHLTLGHALLLARLTGADQVKALYWLLKIDPKTGRELPVLIDEAIESVDGEGWRPGRRVVDATETELRRWIESSVLLQLGRATWRLDDAVLLPLAGACTTCPKRSGSNAALFGDLTADEDVCLDPKCFAAKQDATVEYERDAAKQNGGELLKLTSKRGEERLPAEITARLKFKRGQWVPADEGDCPARTRGLMLDGEDKGKILLVCVHQACRVHKHNVEAPRPASSGAKGLSWEEQRKLAKEKEDAYVAAENPIRRAVYDAVKAKVKLDADGMLREVLEQWIDDDRELDVFSLAEVSGLLPSLAREFKWEEREKYDKTVREALAKRRGADLHALAFDACYAYLIPPNPRLHDDVPRDRKRMWAWAKVHGVDAAAVAKKLTAAVPVVAKAVAKKAAVKVAAKKAGVKVAAKKVAKKVAKKRGAA